jgi:hypothetical protein
MKGKNPNKNTVPGCAEVTGYDNLSGKNVQDLKKGYG